MNYAPVSVKTYSVAPTIEVYVGYTLERYLGQVVRKQRIARRMTQAQLADVAGISQPYLSRVERGDFQSLKKYLQILGAIDIGLLDGFKLDMVPGKKGKS